MNQIKIKPLSVNQVWQGKRYKTPIYKQYEQLLLATLPPLEIPEGNLSVVFDFGFSNSQSDFDNPVKPFLDILQKKYGFNDSRIWRAEINKFKVKKGEEFINFEIKKYL